MRRGGSTNHWLSSWQSLSPGALRLEQLALSKQALQHLDLDGLQWQHRSGPIVRTLAVFPFGQTGLFRIDQSDAGLTRIRSERAGGAVEAVAWRTPPVGWTAI